MKIIAVGDIMPGGVFNKTNNKFVSPRIKKIFSQGDIRVGTLETAIGNEPNFCKEKMERLSDVIYVEDDDIKRLLELNINILSLANNHFFDLGLKGAEHTIELLDKHGIKHCGGGRNLEEASKPVVEIINGKTYAFLAYCDWHETMGWCPFATENEPGINPLYKENVIRDIKKHKEIYDYVVILPHWGTEYDYKPNSFEYKMSKAMIKAGADIILGSHTHCVQPLIKYNKKIIAYGLGNFFFPDRIICPPRSTYYSNNIIDLEKLPVTYSYPYVKEITLKRWRNEARVGMILSLEIDEKNNIMLSERQFVHINENNYVDIIDCPKSLDAHLKKISIGLHSRMYVSILFIYRLFNYISRRLKKN